MEFVRAKSNLALLGPPGVGKTMIAVALAVAACQAGFSIYFTSPRRPRPPAPHRRGHRPVQPTTRRLSATSRARGRRSRLPPPGPAEANMIFQLVSRHYERGSMIITSNKAFTDWGAVLGNDILATAILDRLPHHCDVLAINRPSYRLKDRFDLVTGGEPMP